MTVEQIWIAIGMVGQLAFTARFLVQWLSSESAKKSVIPMAFWYLSLTGGTILLSYAIYRRDPVIIFGQSTGLFVYLRNIILVRRERAQLAAQARADAESQVPDSSTTGLLTEKATAEVFGTVTLPTMVSKRPLWLALSLGLALTVLTIAVRPPLVIDETRYLAVAWEMQVTGDYLVPHLNGEIYSHKPPLLFWLMNIAWALTGNAEWAGRMIAPLAGLATVWLTWGMARRLWPNSPRVADIVPLLLVSMVLWALFSTLTMFDTLLGLATAITLSGILTAADGQTKRGWLIAGLGIGMGLLAKGPIIFVHTLPTACLAPWWVPRTRAGSWSRWYGGVGTALLIGIAVVAAWAVPAIIYGGDAYRDAILWKQTAGRIVDSFAHKQPFWWYLPLIPVFLVPWALSASFWKSIRSTDWDNGVKLCATWIGGGVLILSFVSGKQPHYLIPALPAFALLIGRVISNQQVATRREVAWMGGGTLMAALFLSATPWLPLPASLPLAAMLNPWWGLAIAAGGVAILWPAQRTIEQMIRCIAIAAVCNCGIVHLALADRYFSTCEIDTIALRIAKLQQAGKPIAHHGSYAGQYHFAGRLQAPFEIVVTPEEIADWQQQHPDGYIVGYHWSGESSDWEALTEKHSYRRGLSNHRVGLAPSTSEFFSEPVAVRTPPASRNATAPTPPLRTATTPGPLTAQH